MRTDLKLLTIEDLCRELAVVRRDAGRSHREITAEIERRVNSTQAENAALRKAALEVFYNSVTNCECTTVRESDMIALGEVLGVYGVQEKPAENGAGGA